MHQNRPDGVHTLVSPGLSPTPVSARVRTEGPGALVGEDRNGLRPPTRGVTGRTGAMTDSRRRVASGRAPSLSDPVWDVPRSGFLESEFVSREGVGYVRRPHPQSRWTDWCLRRAGVVPTASPLKV